MNSAIFWDVMVFNLVTSNVSELFSASIFWEKQEHTGKRFLENLGTYQPN
jgi:hypothetical protein